MTRRDAEESKKLILNTAEQVFSEKGFDGARVDEIAKRAGVNKALIYYYFESKEAILNNLLNMLLEDFKLFIERLVSATPDIKDEKFLKESINKIIDMAMEKKNILKVVITESMKIKLENPVILRLVDIAVNYGEKNGKIHNLMEQYTEEDKHNKIFHEFFTGVLPILTYAVFVDMLHQYYGIDETHMREHFVEMFINTHINTV